MDKEQVIQDVFKIVDLESGLVDTTALAKKYMMRVAAVEEFLANNHICSSGYGPEGSRQLTGNLLDEAKQVRGFYKKK
jgi:hypothetical protein